MNTGDNSMDDMASAQKTMRKYGEQLITISQEISEATTVKMLTGCQESVCVAISGSPVYVVKEGVYYSWPYGWEPEDFAIMMRRIFKRKSPFILIIFDELTLLFK